MSKKSLSTTSSGTATAVAPTTGPAASATTSTSPSSPLSKTYRLLLVDDHPVVREGLGARLNAEPDLEIVSEVDPQLARRTRESLLRELEGAQVSGPHFPGLALGRLLAGEGRRYYTAA